MLSGGSPTSHDIRESGGRDVDVLTVKERAVADIMLVASPEVTICVVGSHDNVTVLGKTDHASIVANIGIGSCLAIARSCSYNCVSLGQAIRLIFTEFWGH